MGIRRNKSGMDIENIPQTQLMSLIIILGMGATALIIFHLIAFKFLYLDATIPEGLETRLIVQRFLNSPQCFARFDADLQRSQPLSIDSAYFKEDRLNYCYFTSRTRDPAFRLTLQTDTGSKHRGPIQTSNWFGAKVERIKEYPVLIYENDNVFGGNLVVEIQNYR